MEEEGGCEEAGENMVEVESDEVKKASCIRRLSLDEIEDQDDKVVKAL